jgi:hypothetical protein
MTNRATRRGARKGRSRRVWVFSELNRNLRPEQIAKIITSAGLEQARLEQQARAEQAARVNSPESGAESGPDDEQETHHA